MENVKNFFLCSKCRRRSRVPSEDSDKSQSKHDNSHTVGRRTARSYKGEMTESGYDGERWNATSESVLVR